MGFSQTNSPGPASGIIADLILLACLVAALFSPCLYLPWSLTDDGVVLTICTRRIYDDWSSGNWGQALRWIHSWTHHRFLPCAYGLRWVKCAIYGVNSTVHHFSRLVEMYLMLIIAYAFCRRLGDSRYTGLLGAVLILLSSFSIDSWCRVFPADPLLVFLQIASLYLLLSAQRELGERRRRRLFMVSVAALCASYLSKEVAVQLAPVFLIALFMERRGTPPEGTFLQRRLFCAYFLANMVIFIVIWLINFLLNPRGSPEASLYGLQPDVLLENTVYYGRLILRDYGILFAAALLIFGGRLVSFLSRRKYFDRRFQWEIILFLMVVFSVGIHLPSGLRGSRYLLYTVVSIAIFIALQLQWLGSKLRESWSDYHCPSRFEAVSVMSLLASPVALFCYPAWRVSFGRTLAIYVMVSLIAGAGVTWAIYFFSSRRFRLSVPGLHSCVVAVLAAFILIVIFSSLTAKIVHGVASIKNTERHLMAKDQCNAEVIRFAALNATRGARLFMNMEGKIGAHTRQYFLESGVHLQFFYNRNDLDVVELDLVEDQRMRPGDMVMVWSAYPKYQQDAVMDYLGSCVKPVARIEMPYRWINPFVQRWFQLPPGSNISEDRYAWTVFEVISPVGEAQPAPSENIFERLWRGVKSLAGRMQRFLRNLF